MKSIAVSIAIILTSAVFVAIYSSFYQEIFIIIAGGVELASFWIPLAPTPIFLFPAIALYWNGYYFNRYKLQRTGIGLLVFDFAIKFIYYMFSFIAN